MANSSFSEPHRTEATHTNDNRSGKKNLHNAFGCPKETKNVYQIKPAFSSHSKNILKLIE